MTPSGTRGVLNDALSIYFAGATLASAFVARWGQGPKPRAASSRCVRTSRSHGLGQGCTGRRSRESLPKTKYWNRIRTNPSDIRRDQNRWREVPHVDTPELQPTLSACSSSIDDGVGLPGAKQAGRRMALRVTPLPC
jgi:hypothetical protein